jgi:hypothetical protein
MRCRSDRPLRWLQDWYADHCNGDWEHSFGVALDTLDNPGWSLVIDLAETELAGRTLTPLRIDRTETDWIWASIEDGRFCVRCGPGNLVEAIGLFRRWDQDPDALAGPPGSPNVVE